MNDLEPLAPEKLSTLFKSRPIVHTIWIGLSGFAVIALLATTRGQLWNGDINHAIWVVIAHQEQKPTTMHLPLLFDPAGMLLLFTCTVAPICFAVQIQCIAEFNTMCETNTDYRAATRRRAEINALTIKANTWFARLGSKRAAAGYVIAAVASAAAVGGLIDRTTFFASWNRSNLTDDQWGHIARAGWWLDPTSQTLLFLATMTFLAYMLYMLFKQLTLGFIFSVVSFRQLSLEFGVAPNMIRNSDGYWGLRPLRRFMYWTYFSSFLHLTTLIAIATTWIPMLQVTPLLLVWVAIVNFSVVIFPSYVARKGAILEKERFIAALYDLNADTPELRKRVEDVWTLRELPFRPRIGASALILYLLFPSLVAFVSALTS